MDWTATAEQAKQPGGIVLKVSDVDTDPGTMQRYGLFCMKDFVKQTTDVLMRWSPDRRRRVGLEGRDFVTGSWDRAASIWMDVIEKTPIKDRSLTWDQPVKLLNSEVEIPVSLADKEARIRFLYENVLGTSVDKKGLADWMKSAAPWEKIEKFFRDKARAENRVEKIRCGIVEPQESIVSILDPSDKMRILVAMKETAGDVLLILSVCSGIKKKWPEASLYFFTKEEYFPILEGNPDIKAVLPYDEQVLNYRAVEGFGPERGHFDMAFTPAIVTQGPYPNWIHNGYGKHLLNTYADVCGVEPGEIKIRRDKPAVELPIKYMTIHTGSSLDIKNYDHWEAVIHYIKIPIVQVGSMKDFPVSSSIDLRGKTTPQELAYVLEGSTVHLGVDSFPAHVAGVVGTKSVVLWGSTWHNLCGPIRNTVPILPPHRGDCLAPCHLSRCIDAKSKCINHIRPFDDVILKLKDIDPDICLQEDIV